jgi:hypothetical protein
MSEDGYGLDKAARLAAKKGADIEPPVRLEPEFPFELVAFDPGFWALEELAESLLNR